MKYFLVMLVCLVPAIAHAKMKMVVPCQQNTYDGRTLVSGSALPDNVRYNIASYKPTRRADGWTYGECVLNITRGVSD